MQRVFTGCPVFDPHADPRHEITEWIHGTQWSKYHAESEPKVQKSTPKGALDALQAVGKDEVPSSNLGSSSNPLKTQSFQEIFSLFEVRPLPFIKFFDEGMRFELWQKG